MSEDELIKILDDNPTYLYVCIYHFFTYKNRNYIIELKNDENYNATVSKITSFPYIVGSDKILRV